MSVHAACVFVCVSERICVCCVPCQPPGGSSNLWDLVSVINGQDDSLLPASYSKGVMHMKHLLKFKTVSRSLPWVTGLFIVILRHNLLKAIYSWYIWRMRMSGEVSQPEERRCSVVWWCDGRYFCISLQTAAGSTGWVLSFSILGALRRHLTSPMPLMLSRCPPVLGRVQTMPVYNVSSHLVLGLSLPLPLYAPRPVWSHHKMLSS